MFLIECLLTFALSFLQLQYVHRVSETSQHQSPQPHSVRDVCAVDPPALFLQTHASDHHSVIAIRVSDDSRKCGGNCDSPAVSSTRHAQHPLRFRSAPSIRSSVYDPRQSTSEEAEVLCGFRCFRSPTTEERQETTRALTRTATSLSAAVAVLYVLRRLRR